MTAPREPVNLARPPKIQRNPSGGQSFPGPGQRRAFMALPDPSVDHLGPVL